MEAKFSFSKDIITAGFEDDCVAAGCKVPIKSGDKVWCNMAEEGWQHDVWPHKLRSLSEVLSGAQG